MPHPLILVHKTIYVPDEFLDQGAKQLKKEKSDCIFQTPENEKNNLPLILVFGREPNDDSPPLQYTGKIGCYGSPYSKISMFWAFAYSVYHYLRTECCLANKYGIKNTGEFPLVLTYAGTAPAAHGGVNAATRRNVPQQTYQKHINNVFDLLQNSGLLQRVKLAILSGVEAKAGLAAAHQEILPRLNSKSIPVIELPFCHGRNNKKIEAELLKICP